MKSLEIQAMPLFSDSTLDTVAKAAGAVTAVTASLVAVGKWIAPWAAKRLMVQDVHRGIRLLNTLHETMESAIEAGAAHRIIIFSAHNSGGIPRPGAPFYASAIHWAIDRQWARNQGFADEKLSDYNHLELDHSYVAMLAQMLTAQERRFTTANEPHGLLKSIYEKTGVSDALLVYLGVHDKRMVYASFARYGGEFSEPDLTVIRLKAGLLRGCLSNANA
jgi:hypothetical protein